MLYSFDIFDTLITRATGTPDGVFAIMQHRLLTDSEYRSIPKRLRQDFWYARMNLEQERRNHSTDEDLTIVDIYNFIADVFSLSSLQIQLLIELEIETEINVAVGIQENISRLKKAANRGEQIILISDMYLRSKDIIRILDSVDSFISKHCDIWVSSEIKKTKHRGTLFEHILGQYKVDPSEIIHHGDNIHADIFRARQKHIKTVHYQGSQNNYYENYTVNQKRNNAALQIMVGLSKLARMELETELEQYACTLAGPWICTFVKWVLDSAINDGVNTLFFLSRDGDLLMQVAHRLKKANTAYNHLQFKYLCISRQSAVYPSLKKMDQRAIDHIMQRHPYITLKMIAERTYTSESVLSNYLKSKHGIQLNGSRISTKEHARIENILKADPEIEKMMLAGCNAKKDLILKYFQQEGIFETGTVALVDVGWLCTIQDAVYHIIKDSPFQDRKIIGYYFGITKSSKATNTLNQKKPFVFHSFSPDHIYNKPYYVIWMELFCSSHLEVTQDYIFKDHQVIPNLKPSITNKKRWVDQIRNGIFAYIEQFLRFDQFHALNFSQDQHYYMAAYYNPDQQLSECIGKLQYSGDPLDADIREFAPRFTLGNFYKPGYTKWFEGSIRRSNRHIRLLAMQFIFYKNKAKEITFFIKRKIKSIAWKFLL